MTPDELVERWNGQQAASVADREGRFTAMLDTLELTAGGEFIAVDLAALRQDGFAESGTAWQLFDDYVVYGVV